MMHVIGAGSHPVGASYLGRILGVSWALDTAGERR